MRPIFLLSLPRSGSTMVQRVLGAHPQIATVSEPWLLLSPLYATLAEGVRAEYSHEIAAGALQDFCDALPGGRAEYRAAVRDFALKLYERAGGADAAYFLDKTPRYHAIAGELAEVFPDAKLVFLWRDPLGVLASFLDTFRAGRFEPYNFAFDLFDGVANLTTALSRVGERAHAVRYEDLVDGGGPEWRALFDYLELQFDASLVESFADTELRGRYGDRSSSQEITRDSLDTWRSTVDSRVSSAWCGYYIRWIGAERMAAMGYDHDAALRAIAGVPARSLGVSDAGRLAISWGANRLRRTALRLPEGPRPLV